jgi:hypothetical protein
MTEVSVGELAKELDVPPWRISTLYYRRILDCDKCPVVAGRRMIPRSYIPTIRAAIKSHSRKETT